MYKDNCAYKYLCPSLFHCFHSSGDRTAKISTLSPLLLTTIFSPNSPISRITSKSFRAIFFWTTYLESFNKLFGKQVSAKFIQESGQFFELRVEDKACQRARACRFQTCAFGLVVLSEHEGHFNAETSCIQLC